MSILYKHDREIKPAIMEDVSYTARGSPWKCSERRAVTEKNSRDNKRSKRVGNAQGAPSCRRNTSRAMKDQLQQSARCMIHESASLLSSVYASGESLLGLRCVHWPAFDSEDSDFVVGQTVTVLQLVTTL